jgi:O-antigen/teichoic acid export membrane protein
MGAGLGISVLLARTLGAEEFGHYVFAFSVVTILSIPVQAGLPSLLTKSLPKYEVTEDFARLRGLLLFTVLFTLAFSGLALIAYWAVNLWLTQQFGGYAGRETVNLAILLLPFIALSTSVGAAVRSLGRLLVGQVIETGFRQFTLLAMLGAVALGAAGAQLSAKMAMQFHIAAAVVTTAVGGVVLVLGCSVLRGPAGVLMEWRKWILTLVPLSLIAGLNIILSKSDVVMLRGLIGAEDVAIYFIANQLGNLVFLAGQAVRLVKGPMLSRAVQMKDLGTLQHVYSRGALFVFLFAVPAVVLLLLFGATIIGLVFGPEYRSAYPVVAVIAIGYVVQALFGNTELLLKVTDNEWLVMRAMILAIIANLGLNALMIPWLGALGAALASVTVTLCLKGYLAREIRRRVGISAFALVRKHTVPEVQ